MGTYVPVRSKVQEREAARLLRARGLSLRTIAASLGVSLSSASVWTRDVPQPEVATESLEEPEASSGSAHCGRCNRDLPLASFHRSGGTRQSWCRRCRSEYMRERGDVHRQQTYAARRKRRDTARAYVVELRAASDCADCHIADPVVLEFDHVKPKRNNVSDLVTHGYSIAAIAREIMACEVVCANCHRRRTAQRRASLRGIAGEQRTRESRAPRRRNVEFVRRYLLEHPCVECGEDDSVLLDFDHIGRKRASVATLAWREHSLAAIEREIEECEVRCANCHRRRTCETLNQFPSDALGHT